MPALDHDVAVIGSGFGGSVAALRSAEAGRRVLVLEQGRRLTPADLAAGGRSPWRLLWEPAIGLTGYFRQTLLRHVFVVSGVGVGGGSIVYAAVLLEAPEAAFDAPGWKDTGLDWAAELAPHYATAATKLGRRTNPHRSAQDEWLEAAARDLGAHDTYGSTPQGIDFDACVRCGACLSGCPHGAKNSLDLTYLAEAEALGARVVPQAKVVRIAPLGGPDPDGSAGWRLDVVDPTRRGRTLGSTTAKEVVVAGGVLGTMELLLACRDRWGTLPGLSGRLGQMLRTNSEALVAVLQPDASIDVSDGATISSDFYPDAVTHVTNNRFPQSYGFMRWFSGPLADGETPSARRRHVLSEMARHPLHATANLRAREWHRRVTVLTVMQHADNALALRYEQGPVGWRLVTEIPEGDVPAPVYLPVANDAARAVARASGGRPYGVLMESLLGKATTAHILGGAVIGADAGRGVVDTEHRVFGYRGLQVLDGSAVPANIGVNPSLTITALAERAMARRYA